MKLGLVVLAGVFASVSAFAQDCPEQFTVTYNQVVPVEWSEALQSADAQIGGRLHLMWDELTRGPRKIELAFSRYTVSADSCRYSANGLSGTLQILPENQLDIAAFEFPVGSGFQAFFRSTVKAFDASSITLSQDSSSLTLWAPAAYDIDSDGGITVSNWMPIGYAKSVAVTVGR